MRKKLKIFVIEFIEEFNTYFMIQLKTLTKTLIAIFIINMPISTLTMYWINGGKNASEWHHNDLLYVAVFTVILYIGGNMRHMYKNQQKFFKELESITK